MANEISLTLSLSHTKTPKVPFQPGALNIDQTGTGVHAVTASIGTSEEDVTFGDIATEGVCVLWNLDATNYVQFGRKDGSGNMQAIGRLRPGGIPAVFPFEPGATLRMQANTAACQVHVVVYEE